MKHFPIYVKIKNEKKTHRGNLMTSTLNLLLGQRSGLVPVDILPLVLLWTCYAARPAVAHGSNNCKDNYSDKNIHYIQ